MTCFCRPQVPLRLAQRNLKHPAYITSNYLFINKINLRYLSHHLNIIICIYFSDWKIVHMSLVICVFIFKVCSNPLTILLLHTYFMRILFISHLQLTYYWHRIPLVLTVSKFNKFLVFAGNFFFFYRVLVMNNIFC